MSYTCIFMISLYAETNLFLTCTVAWNSMLDFCIDTITSDRLTFSSPMVKRWPIADDACCELLTESSALLKASAKFTFAAGISVWIAGIFASGRVAADFSCAIIASILPLSIPPVFTLPPDSGLILVAPREQNPGLQGNDGYNNFHHMLPWVPQYQRQRQPLGRAGGKSAFCLDD